MSLSFVPPIYKKHEKKIMTEGNIRALFLAPENVGFLTEILFQSIFRNSPLLRNPAASNDLRRRIYHMTEEGTTRYFFSLEDDRDLEEGADGNYFSLLSVLNRDYLEFSYLNILQEPQSLFLVERKDTTQSPASYADDGTTWAPENMFIHNAVNGGDNAWRAQQIFADDAGRKNIFPYNQYPSGIPFWQVIRNLGEYEDRKAFAEGLRNGGEQLETPVYGMESVSEYQKKKENFFKGKVTPETLRNYVYEPEKFAKF